MPRQRGGNTRPCPIHAAGRRLRLKIIAMQRVPHTLAIHVAPERPQLFRLALPKIAHGANVRIIEPRLHAPTNAGNGLKRQGEERLRQKRWIARW